MTKYGMTLEITDKDIVQDIFWATKIAKEDNAETFENYAIVKDGNLTVTDRFRIHQIMGISQDKIPSGNYAILYSSPNKVIIAILEEAQKIKIPDFKSIFDKLGKQKFSSEILVSSNKTTMAIDFAKMIRAFPEPTAIAYAFIEDLGFSDAKFGVAWFSTESPVIFTLGNKKAAIMPISLE